MAHILILDDVPEILDTMGTFLSAYEHTVSVFTDPRRALDNFPLSHFDLIITDALMPHINGDEFICRLNEMIAPKRIPIIVLSGGATDNKNKSLLNNILKNVDFFLTKPVAPDQLLDTVNRALALQTQSTKDKQFEAVRLGLYKSNARRVL